MSSVNVKALRTGQGASDGSSREQKTARCGFAAHSPGRIASACAAARPPVSTRTHDVGRIAAAWPYRSLWSVPRRPRRPCIASSWSYRSFTRIRRASDVPRTGPHGFGARFATVSCSLCHSFGLEACLPGAMTKYRAGHGISGCSDFASRYSICKSIHHLKPQTRVAQLWRPSCFWVW